MACPTYRIPILRPYIVVDLGFGDGGKGLLTDFLVRSCQASLVVRYNGGAQAGHNVIAPDGRHHTFSQFGSGTFVPGVKTYLSRHVVIHPTALLVEGQILADKGVSDAFSRLRVSEQSLVTTPFHQAANRIRELVRGPHRHGSCGVGVGEAVADAGAHPEDAIHAGDLGVAPALRRKLRAIRERKHDELAALLHEGLPDALISREWTIFESDETIDRWIGSVSKVVEIGLVAPDSVLEGWLTEAEAVVFEGAQGVLLDADAGFHPFTTWSRCTAANALELIDEFAPGSPPVQVGVMRSYTVRHGPGPLPTETRLLAPVVSEHNRPNEWQGPVRYGWFDAVLAGYAVSVLGGVDSLMVTHLDVLAHLKRWDYCLGYEAPDGLDASHKGWTRSGWLITGLHPSPSLDLAQRAQFTEALGHLVPRLGACEPDERQVIQTIESLLGCPVGLISCGPTAADVHGTVPVPR